MHDAAPASYHAPQPPAPPVDGYDQTRHYYSHDPPIYVAPDEPLLPDEPPPSYDDTVAVSGAPPDYGTFRQYAESSVASSEVESSDRSLPEWLGQIIVVSVFICLIYGFWKFIDSPDLPSGRWPGNGRLGPSM
ncbi:uncharacterized protein SETTUDRAFT_45818 [Exserohilum turcica Et28A]|uniref:Uncharacterized protein n=1 Tax=Exserohilum turcicum (strain 28A) TaxID=671987 RepID=R0IYR7_EXST2|nr:uncharacterized protein SETTUDRAFT_45818 [Exserohilum turcica Et28A]EOA89676.1 hypothetical protein SETTUDRAFT_45818 [Exserohilum turcica Et28A]